jgi:hypothetical protein
MMEEDEIRRRIERLLHNTANAEGLPPGMNGFWVGDVADERRVMDNFAAGRSSWDAARSTAKLGLEAIDRGEVNLAEEFVLMATDFYIAALETRIRPSDLAVLGRSSQKRGRPRKI